MDDTITSTDPAGTPYPDAMPPTPLEQQQAPPAD
jgi:hypothetical protein